MNKITNQPVLPAVPSTTVPPGLIRPEKKTNKQKENIKDQLAKLCGSQMGKTVGEGVNIEDIFTTSKWLVPVIG